jgi:hypothetical protein
MACNAKLKAKHGDPSGIFISPWPTNPRYRRERPKNSVFRLILLPFSTVKSRLRELKAV